MDQYPGFITGPQMIRRTEVSGSLALGIKKPASKTIGGKIMTKNICGVKYLFYEFELCEFIFII